MVTARYQDHPTKSGATVLCIDDDPEISRGIRMRLERYGVDVLQAYFGTHGLWLALQKHPDLIITDLRMPQGDGIYVVQWLRSNPQTQEIPIIVLSGRAEIGLERRLRQQGVDCFLHKPARFDDLLAALAKHIELSPSAPPRETEPASP